jgi:uncharacterized protein (UPF0212 family)
MANTFKNKLGVGVGTSESSVYTVPSSTTTTVIGLSVANVTGSNITVDIRVYDSSANSHAYVIKTGAVFTGGTLVAVGGDQKLVLEAADIIKVVASASSSADVIISYMEQT